LLRNSEVGRRSIHLYCLRKAGAQEFVRNGTYAATNVEERVIVATLCDKSVNEEARSC
jgi:hypothetical protein